jgi:Co/Zn/Cd efflux system component
MNPPKKNTGSNSFNEIATLRIELSGRTKSRISMARCANDHCSSDTRQPDGRYRRVLGVALVLNGGMFLTEIVAGLAAGSAALQADAVDFLSDAANSGISLSVLGLVLVWRARAALVKGVSMGLLGLWVAGNTLWHAVMGTLPAAEVMGVVGVLALRVNGGVAFMLYRYRGGDSNMRSVWICARNDASAMSR